MSANDNNNSGLPPPPPPPHPAPTNISLLSVLSREKLTGPLYLNWIRALRITLRFEGKEYVLDVEIPELADDATNEDIAAYDKHYDDSTKVACLMLATMTSELQKSFKTAGAYGINLQLKEMFQEWARQERFEIVKSLIACKQQDEVSVRMHVQNMKSYIDRLENLGV